MLWVSSLRIGWIPQFAIQQVVTSEAFLRCLRLWVQEIHSGKEVTNFYPICDEFHSVHEAMKSKVGRAICKHTKVLLHPSKISGNF